MKILGIDYGTKKAGLAISDEGGRIAFPLSVVPTAKLLEVVQNICKTEPVGSIILGESKDFSGAPNPVMEKISAFKKELEENIGLPVILEPEFLTSKQARNISDSGAMNDSSAAALILQSALDKVRKT